MMPQQHRRRRRAIRCGGPGQRAVTFAVLTAMLAGPVLSQDAAEDWDLTEDPRQQLTLATLNFGANQVALRCKAGALDFLLTGVPPTDEALRQVRVTAGAIQDESQTWFAWSGQPIASPAEPERFARVLRAGAELDIRLEPVATGERPYRYRFPVPPSATSVDRVLSACSIPLVDDWDLLPRGGAEVVWVRQPAPDFPELALHRGIESGSVRLGCIVAAGGTLDECRVQSESPAGVGFGSNAVRSAERARLGLPEDQGAAIGKVISFTIRFRIS